MASIFTQIVRGELPCYRIWEDPDFLAFLDINPVNPGHTLVIPKIEVEYIFDLPDPLYVVIWQHVRRLAGALQLAAQCKKVGIAVEGFGVPHVHVHLIPVNALGELNPERAVAAEPAELEAVQKQILRVLQSTGAAG